MKSEEIYFAHKIYYQKSSVEKLLKTHSFPIKIFPKRKNKTKKQKIRALIEWSCTFFDWQATATVSTTCILFHVPFSYGGAYTQLKVYEHYTHMAVALWLCYAFFSFYLTWYFSFIWICIYCVLHAFLRQVKCASAKGFAVKKNIYIF